MNDNTLREEYIEALRSGSLNEDETNFRVSEEKVLQFFLSKIKEIRVRRDGELVKEIEGMKGFWTPYKDGDAIVLTKEEVLKAITKQ